MSGTLIKMARQLSNDLRERIIRADNEGKHPDVIADIIGCHRTTVDRIIKLYDREERIEVNLRGGQKSRLLSEEYRIIIRNYISENCSITLESIKRRLMNEYNLEVSISTINRAISSFNFTFKRVSLIPEKRNDPGTIETRYEYARSFLSHIGSKDGENIFFLDEAGFSASMRAKGGRAPRGQRAVQTVPNLRTRNISMCCVMSKRGIFFYKKQPRPFNTETFKVFLRDLLIKFNEYNLKNVVLIMDNVPFHHSRDVHEIICDTGNILKFFPPYSPFLNPIENLFSQWKQLVRSGCPQSVEELLNLIDSSFNSINGEHCCGYHRHMFDMISKCINKEVIEDE
jgi:transposase